MRILITGGAGLIGQAIAKRHIAEGHEVLLYDDLSNKFNDYSNLHGENIAFDKQGNLRDISQIIKSHEPFDVISHQAASVGVGESQYEIEKYSQNNIGFTAHLLDSLVKSQKVPTRLLLASSMGPYGEGPYYCESCCVKMDLSGPRKTINPACRYCNRDLIPLIIKENCERKPTSFYGITKMAQEEMFRVFSETYGITTIALRYFSVYGTKCNPNNPYTGVLSIIADKILNAKSVELFEDGLQTRDLIHCDDVAKAHFLASKYERSPADGRFTEINICTGVRTSIRDVAYSMMQLIAPGLSSKPIQCSNEIRKGDIRHSCGENKKARELLGWNPEWKISTGILEYCHFVKMNREKFSIDKDSTGIEKERLVKSNLIIKERQ